MQKSISISGMVTRSGFRKRSKSRPYSSGSISVMRRAYATRLPAADPRPGPTGMPRDRAKLMMSHTIRKYPAYPIVVMTSNSSRSRSR